MNGIIEQIKAACESKKLIRVDTGATTGYNGKVLSIDAVDFVMEYELLSGRTNIKSIGYDEIKRVRPICQEAIRQCRLIARYDL